MKKDGNQSLEEYREKLLEKPLQKRSDEFWESLPEENLKKMPERTLEYIYWHSIQIRITHNRYTIICYKIGSWLPLSTHGHAQSLSYHAYTWSAHRDR